METLPCNFQILIKKNCNTDLLGGNVLKEKNLKKGSGENLRL